MFQTEADESPLEPGVFLFPGRTTDIQPPDCAENQIARWTGFEWICETVAEPTPLDKLVDFLIDNPDVWTLINSELDAKYSSKGLSNGLSD